VVQLINKHITIIEVITLTISIFALIISTSVVMWGWWRNRNIYDVEYHVYDTRSKKSSANIKFHEKIKSGKYTVLNTHDDYPHLLILLERIKK